LIPRRRARGEAGGPVAERTTLVSRYGRAAVGSRDLRCGGKAASIAAVCGSTWGAMRGLLPAAVVVVTVATSSCAGAPSAARRDLEARPTGFRLLSEEEIRAVREREAHTLQACWDTAVREIPDVGDVRLDIDITISASGAVDDAQVRGPIVGTLSECVEQSCRLWRFPESSAPTMLTFPVVFSPR
jgi:hypothetical protein